MEDEDFTVAPVGNDDPLASLGLVDVRTGRAVATDEWSPGDAGNPPLNPADRRAAGLDDDEAEGNEPPSTNVDPAATQSRQTQQRPGTPNWDSDDNPFKKQFTELQARVGATPDPVETARQNYAQREQVLNQERQTAYNLLTTQGIDGQVVAPGIARAMVDALHTAAITAARSETDRAALLPIAKQAVAQDIARKHSTGGVTVTPEELMNETTQEAMQARARTLQESRRDGKFQQRKTGRVDRADGASSGGTGVAPGAMDNLSPISRISLGLRRGEL